MAEHASPVGSAAPSGTVTERGAYREGSFLRSRAVQTFLRNRNATGALVIFAVLLLLSAGAPLVAGVGPDVVNPYAYFQPPSVAHILGTDQVGRDILARTLYGGQISLFVGIMAVTLKTVIALGLGTVSGYFGGLVDMIIQRIVDIMMAFPTLMLLLILVAVLGPSIANVFIAIGLLSWPHDCRFFRGQVLAVRSSEYITAAQSVGVPSSRIITRYVIPNIIGFVAVNFTFGIGAAILTESGISYLGLGVPLPTPSWGNMIQQANSISVLQSYWWLWVPPSFALVLCVLSLNAIGDALRDVFDPRQLG